jgi:proline racemase
LYREGKRLAGRNAVVIQPGKIDRSPCGTGLSARMAVLHAKGQMQVNDKLIGRSIIGSCFEGQILGRIAVGEHVAIRPAISGQGWITGTHQHTIDPTDPWPQGYRISDTWPEML